jgi:hypothetical protein
MAPELFSGNAISASSKVSDVYSLAMTSFKACFYAMNNPTIQCNYLVTIRFSQGYYHMVTVVGTRSSLILSTVNDHPVQWTQVRTDGCGALFGIRSRPVGAINPNSGINFLLCTMCFRDMVCRMP